MDQATTYRDILKRIILEYASVKPAYGDIQVETIFDDAAGHYELSYSGWMAKRRVHGSVIHADIRDDKVWIQHDGTEDGIAEELVAAGIPREHIVLAFHAPYLRELTPYAVA